MNPSLWVSYFIIGPLAPLVDWPFHSHFSHAKNLRFPLPEKCPFSLVQRPFVFCQRFSAYLGIAHYRFFHQSTTICETSNNGNSGTSLVLIPFIYCSFTFFTSPLLFFNFIFIFSCRAGIAVPAHTLRGWVTQRMGDPRRLPNPLGHAPNGDLQKLFFHNFSSDNFK